MIRRMTTTPPAAPLISVIVAVYNRAATLQQCLDSVAAQSYPNRELLVQDGGSTDGTLAVIEKNRARLAHAASGPDRGVYDAWNRALARTRGEWVCFLGSDDYLWDDGVLARYAAALAALPSATMLAGATVAVVGPGGEALRTLGEPWETARAGFRDRMTIPHPGLMHRRELFARRGLFDPSFRIAGDYEFLLRELPAGEVAFLPGFTAVAMREGGLSADPARWFRTARETWRAQRLHGRWWPAPELRSALLRSGARALLDRALGRRASARLRRPRRGGGG